MKFYYAGLSNDKQVRDILDGVGVKYRLISYACYNKPLGNILTLPKNHKLMIDSGAFSVWTGSKEKIDINKYIKFLKTNMEYIDYYISLDDMCSAEKSYENLLIMRDAGLNPLPVFHGGEDFEWLKKLVKLGYNFILLGSKTAVNKLLWFKQIFCEYHPQIKFHGLGLVSLKYFLEIPFYSVDFTSFFSDSLRGNILLLHQYGDSMKLQRYKISGKYEPIKPIPTWIRDKIEEKLEKLNLTWKQIMS